MKKLGNFQDHSYLLDFLNEVGINYFSCTTFNEKQNPLFSTCNNDSWLSIYNQKFFPKPPVQDLILNQKKGLIWWDPALYDKSIANFLKLRDEVCETKIICTLVPRKGNKAAAISFGSKYNHSHVIRFLQNNNPFVQGLFNYYLDNF